MNKKWEEKCGLWLYHGTTIKTDCVAQEHRGSWQRLVDFMKVTKEKTPGAANLFLDALAFHGNKPTGKDATRVDATLQ